jgi:predicted Rossmann fold nucleotide-binding protein DprA/Smf involved in DNA uptake
MIDDGAMPFTGSAEILAEYGLASQQQTQGVEELAIDGFLARHALSPADLLKLELAEIVERLPGNRVRVKAV